jgi:pyruvate kinase
VTKKRKKIITIDPASADRKVLTRLIKSGIDIARLNFSHNDQKLHQQVIKNIRQLNKEIAILENIAGSNIRIGQIGKNKIALAEHETVIVASSLDLADINADSLAHKVLPIDYKDIAVGVKKSDRIFIKNNSIVLLVDKVEDKLIYAKVIQGGQIISCDDVSVPGQSNDAVVSRQDVLAAIKLKPDYVSLFASDLAQLKKAKKLFKNSSAKLLVKLENFAQVKSIIKGIKVVDGLFIDRQRLSLEIPQSKLEIIERDLIQACQATNKIVM